MTVCNFLRSLVSRISPYSKIETEIHNLEVATKAELEVIRGMQQELSVLKQEVLDLIASEHKSRNPY